MGRKRYARAIHRKKKLENLEMPFYQNGEMDHATKGNGQWVDPYSQKEARGFLSC